MSKIHPSSVVEDGAILGDDVVIGPFCQVGANVKLGNGVELKSHVALAGYTTIGDKTRVFPFASVGHEPQDLKYAGEKSTLDIGSNCTIREGVTINPGTAGGGGSTVIGNNCAFLANSHVAHDCQVGNNVIMSNNAGLMGHCVVGDFVIFGGAAGAHQFCRIGHHAFVGAATGLEGDLIPFGMAVGNRASLAGLNLIGMKRSGVSRESIHAVRNAFKALFVDESPISENAQKLLDTSDDEMVLGMAQFVVDSRDRSLCTPKQSSR